MVMSVRRDIDIPKECPSVKIESVTPSGQYMDSLLSKADGAGLLWEVVWFALWHMKKNPKLAVEEAVEIGYSEWVK